MGSQRFHFHFPADSKTIYFPSASLEAQGREKRYLGALRSSAGFLGLLGVIELFMMVGDPQT